MGNQIVTKYGILLTEIQEIEMPYDHKILYVERDGNGVSMAVQHSNVCDKMCMCQIMMYPDDQEMRYGCDNYVGTIRMFDNLKINVFSDKRDI